LGYINFKYDQPKYFGSIFFKNKAAVF